MVDKNEGYCQEDALGHYRVFTITDCSNKARYRLTFQDGRTKDVCGTHFRPYVIKKNPKTGELISVLHHVKEVYDLKKNKIIWPKSE